MRALLAGLVMLWSCSAFGVGSNYTMRDVFTWTTFEVADVECLTVRAGMLAAWATSPYGEPGYSITPTGDCEGVPVDIGEFAMVSAVDIFFEGSYYTTEYGYVILEYVPAQEVLLAPDSFGALQVLIVFAAVMVVGTGFIAGQQR